jgi:MFS family permease
MNNSRKAEAAVSSLDLDEPPSHEAALPPVDRRFALTTFSAFRVAPFKWLFISSVVGTLGYQMQGVALGWLVYVLTGSAVYLGAVTTTESICQTLISPIGGVFADRFERRNYILLVRVITVVAAAALVVLVGTHRVTILDLIIAAAFFGLAFGLNGPARQALVAQLVGKDLLMNAVSLMSGGMNLMRIFGPAAAGLLIGVIGVQGIYGILLICYIAVMVALLPVPRQPVEPRVAPQNMIGDISDGLSYCYRDSAVFGLLLVGTIPLFFAMPYIALLPIFAEKIWHSGAIGYGILSAAPGVGGLMGALGIASFSNARNKGRIIIGGAVVYGLALSIFAISPNIPIAIVFLALAGAMGVSYSATVSSVVQTIIPNEMRGRVMSLYQMSYGISGLSALPASAIAGFVGAPITIAGCGILAAASSLIILKFRPVLGSL